MADIYGDDAANILDGFANEDDNIYAYDGDDDAYGDSGDDYMDGWFGNDYLYGEDGDDYLLGYTGYDVLYGGDGHDYLNGEEDDDSLYGEAGDDVLDGWTGHDWLEGGDGDDTLLGYDGDDVLDGGAGDDWLAGEYGADEMWGGEGDDTFYYYSTWDSNSFDGTDWIWDFEEWDTIDLTAIDADLTQDGDQAFSLDLALGEAGALEVVYDESAGAYHASMDVDGGGADMELWVVSTSLGDVLL